MNKTIINTILYTFKFISLTIIITIILVNSDVFTELFDGRMKNFLTSVISFCNDNTSNIFSILFICLVVYLSSALVIHFLKLNEESDSLESQNEYYNEKIEEINKKYDTVSNDNTSFKKALSKAKMEIYKETQPKIQNVKDHYTKIKYHYENRNNNYFNTNKSLYDIVKSSKRLDKNTLKLIEEFENDISR